MAAETAYAAAVVDNYPAIFSFAPAAYRLGSADASAIPAAGAEAVVYFRFGGKRILKLSQGPGKDKFKELGRGPFKSNFDIIRNPRIFGQKAGVFDFT